VSKSAYVRRLDEIVQTITPDLRAAGFRKKGRTFNRVVEDGLVHVVGFQMGVYPVGGVEKYVIPGLRESFYGQYTVNFGVHIREVYELTLNRAAPVFCQDYNCEVRARIGELRAHPADVWWHLSADSPNDEMPQLLRRAVAEWFPLFSARERILAIGQEQRKPVGWPHRGKLVQAIMWAHRGSSVDAETSLRAYWADYLANPINPGHGDFIRDIARRLQIELDR
jgi:hypothetical protein